METSRTIMQRDLPERAAYRLAAKFQKAIGIYRTSEQIFVTEVRQGLRKISTINKKEYSHGEYTFEEILQQIIKDFKIKEHLISTNLYAPGAFFKVLNIPQLPDDEIDDWLKENLARIVDIKIPLNQTALAYRVIKRNEDLQLLIGLCSKKEVQDIEHAFKKCNLPLTKLVYGLSFYFRPEYRKSENDICNYIIQLGNHALIITNRGQLRYYNEIPAVIHKGETDKENLIRISKQMFDQDLKLLDSLLKTEHTNWHDISSKDFSLSVMLAKNALRYPNERLQFLPEQANQTARETIWKQALIKLTLGLGSFLIFLYVVSFLVSFIFVKMNDTITEKMNMLAPQVAAIERLNQQKRMLARDLSEARQMQDYRSKSYLILEALAYHIPEKCWLTEIIYDKYSDEILNTGITGMSRDRSIVYDYLSSLESDPNIPQVKLDYIKSIPADRLYRDWKLKSSRYLEFRISIEF